MKEDSTMSSEPTIKSRIDAYTAEIENGDPRGIGLKLRKAALSAIYGGWGSPAWYYYMAYFANSPKQLRRLCTSEIDCHKDTPAARAYLVGNAVCLPETWRTFGKGVEHYLDVTLDQYPD
jgi:hypothetical protein